MHAARLSNVAVLEPPRRLRHCSHRPHLQMARVRHISIFWKLPSYQDKVNDKIYAAVIQCGSLCNLTTPLLLHSQALNGGCFYFQSFFNVCISTEYPVPLCYEDGETKIEELPYCSGKSAGLAIQGSLVRSSALQSFGWDYKLRSRLRHDIVVRGTLNSKHHHHHHLNTVIDIHLTFEGW